MTAGHPTMQRQSDDIRIVSRINNSTVFKRNINGLLPYFQWFRFSGKSALVSFLSTVISCLYWYQVEAPQPNSLSRRMAKAKVIADSL